MKRNGKLVRSESRGVQIVEMSHAICGKTDLIKSQQNLRSQGRSFRIMMTYL